jgi:hypothetical protein
LPDDAATTGAERQSNGNLTLTSRGAREEKVCDIDACDHQHKDDHTHQHE